jgi:hypothetical protein
MKRIVLTVVALGFLVAGVAVAQDCALGAVFAPADAAAPAGGLFVEPQDAQIIQCPGSVYTTYVTYYSDATRTVVIGSCTTVCGGEQTCEGSTSRYFGFHRSCCTN